MAYVITDDENEVHGYWDEEDMPLVDYILEVFGSSNMNSIRIFEVKQECFLKIGITPIEE